MGMTLRWLRRVRSRPQAFGYAMPCLQDTPKSAFHPLLEAAARWPQAVVVLDHVQILFPKEDEGKDYALVKQLVDALEAMCPALHSAVMPCAVCPSCALHSRALSCPALALECTPLQIAVSPRPMPCWQTAHTIPSTAVMAQAQQLITRMRALKIMDTMSVLLQANRA